MTISAKIFASIFASLGMITGSLHAAPLSAAAASAPVNLMSITSVSGPTALAVNQEGTWTVNVTDNDASSSPNLHYSVKWGDENTMMRAAAVSQAITASSTFTHAYGTKGTYHPVFTVSNSNGISASKTVTVVVGQTVNSPAHIASLSPASGLAGSVVTITGTGFTASSTVRVGTTTLTNVTVHSSTSLTFTVPSTTPAGKAHIRVMNGRTMSNLAFFTVTAPGTAHLSVNGIDAPAVLTVGQDGTWTVHASSNVSGTLHYAVTWGDENRMMHAFAALMPTTQTSATFTHAYGTAGSYQPKFTISDDAGHSTSVSASVLVQAQ